MMGLRIYEINTWPWLSELSERYGTDIDLESVPDPEWDALQAMRFDAVWLMGVWERSAEGRTIAQGHPMVLAQCARVLPAFNPARDIIGSPYSIRSYTVDTHLGGASALKVARRKLHARGLRLFLDYVPNHTGRDHGWMHEASDCYVGGTQEDLARQPGRFFAKDGRVMAHGAPSRNPNDVWTDTAQLNAWSNHCRALTVDTLMAIGRQCDGVRCDMAHLLRTAAFEELWGAAAGPKPATEFWVEVLQKVRHQHPEMLFVAECYGDTQAALVQDGFDACYDKERFYDRLRASDCAGLRRHLEGTGPEQMKHLVHFISNHDEDPVEQALQPPERHRMAAVAVATLPGPSLWHHLQLEGRWGKQLVQLGTSVLVRSFYQRLLVATDRPAIRQGRWSMCELAQAPTVLAYCSEYEDDRIVVVLNLSAADSQGMLRVPWPTLAGRRWIARDLLSGEQAEHAGDDLVAGTMTVQLPAWGAKLIEVVGQ
jgi:hypothetical protein